MKTLRSSVQRPTLVHNKASAMRGSAGHKSGTQMISEMPIGIASYIGKWGNCRTSFRVFKWVDFVSLSKADRASQMTLTANSRLLLTLWTGTFIDALNPVILSHLGALLYLGA